uniref:Uncharacterized protein n=1 Tax=viral metagenome TaxID=1070528 RepID=A0A6H1ZR41_9ZZZZ
MFKGVLRCYEGKRKVTIKVVDIYGHKAIFIPNDIPQLIEDIKIAHNLIKKDDAHVR